MPGVRVSTRRAGVVAPPATFLALIAVVASGAADIGELLVWLALCVVSGYFTVRAWRVGVEMTESRLVVRDQLRTHTIEWSAMQRARLEPMRTASPLRNVMPYLALAVDFTSGMSKQFEGVSVAEGVASELPGLIEEVNRRIAAA